MITQLCHNLRKTIFVRGRGPEQFAILYMKTSLFLTYVIELALSVVESNLFGIKPWFHDLTKKAQLAPGAIFTLIWININPSIYTLLHSF